MTTARQVELVAETLDSQGKDEAPIVVTATRGTLRATFPPAKRGGPLRCGKHELVLVARPPKAEPLANMDLFEATP